ncbi:uncharacterized protein LOC144657225 [Oculina patagonica]
MHFCWSCVLAFLAILRCSTADPMIYGTAALEHDWAEAFKLIITVKMEYPVDGWRMALIFSQPIKKIEVWRAKWLDAAVSEDKMMHPLKELYFTKKLAKGKELTFAVKAFKCVKNTPPGNVTVLFKGGNVIPRLPTEPPPTTPTTPPQQQIPIYPLKPIDESDSGFKMIIEYQVPAAVKYWSISLKFTKNISTRNFNIDKATVKLPKKPTSDAFCLGPKQHNKHLKANFSLRLEFNAYKAKLYEAAPNAFFIFNPDSSKCQHFDLPTPVPGPAVPQESADAVVIQQWPPNNFKMRFEVQVINSVRGGWKIALEFSKPVAEISNLNTAKLAGKSKDRRTYFIQNFPGQIQNANLKQCEKIKIEFSGKLAPGSSSSQPLSATAQFERKEPEYAEVNLHGACP